ncbi:MAG TPA: tetratricopeptide repeat protein, partial [Chloroflexota bacterium]|nr:tetratricopeptide repeat protein [Chloroflexota bacterium]
AAHHTRDAVVRASLRPRPAGSSDVPTFVGRERELALLERHLGGEGGLLAVPDTMGTHEPAHGLAALYAALAHLHFAGGRTGEQRTAELARVLAVERILVDAENRRGLALFMVGRMDEAQRVLEEAIPLAEAVGDLDILARVLTNVANVCIARGEREYSRRYAERALAVAERRGDAAQVVFAAVTLAADHFHTGDWHQARRHLERALNLSRVTGAPRVVAPPLLLLGRLCLAEGAWDEAFRYLEEGRSAAQGSASIGLLLDAQTLLAEREILEGRPDAHCARLAALLAAAGQDLWCDAHVEPTLAWAHLERDDVAAAAEVVRQAVRRARAVSYRRGLVEALRVQAMIATRQGRWEDAESSLAEGLSLARSMADPYVEGRLLHVYGAMLARKGQLVPARQRLEEALAILRRLGACGAAAQVEGSIAALAQN